MAKDFEMGVQPKMEVIPSPLATTLNNLIKHEHGRFLLALQDIMYDYPSLQASLPHTVESYYLTDVDLDRKHEEVDKIRDIVKFFKENGVKRYTEIEAIAKRTGALVEIQGQVDLIFKKQINKLLGNAGENGRLRKDFETNFRAYLLEKIYPELFPDVRAFGQLDTSPRTDNVLEIIAARKNEKTLMESYQKLVGAPSSGSYVPAERLLNCEEQFFQQLRLAAGIKQTSIAL